MGSTPQGSPDFGTAPPGATHAPPRPAPCMPSPLPMKVAVGTLISHIQYLNIFEPLLAQILIPEP